MQSLPRMVIAVVLGLVLTGLIPAAALAWDASCNSGEMCSYWSNGPFVVPLAANSGGDSNYSGDVYPGTQQSLNGSVSSIRNLKTSGDVVWFFDAGYSGTSFCLDAVYEAGYLGSHNDQYSSHLIAASDTC